jgi:ESCRT-I complex subunit VPS28
MQRPAIKLTIDEKQNADLQREIYVLIRLIDVIEKCAQLSDDRISPEEHFTQMSKFLEKLDTL